MSESPNGQSQDTMRVQEKDRVNDMPAKTPDLRLKRIYDSASEDDGVRVLVDRLWPRGVRKEMAKLTLWAKDIAPSPELRVWFNHDPARFAEFSRRYRLELAAKGDAVGLIDDLLKRGRVTLLFAAHDAVHNHAVVLADYLKERRRRRTIR
jgi:uncharacterized protein YeaO (DUF488 family)